MVLAWGIIAPGLIATGRAVGMPTSEEFPLVSYQAMSFEEAEAYAKSPSPRYWLLWPGVLIMMVYSFVELFFSLGPSSRNLVAVISIHYPGVRSRFVSLPC